MTFTGTSTHPPVSLLMSRTRPWFPVPHPPAHRRPQFQCWHQTSPPFPSPMRSGLVLNIEIRVAGQGGCDVVVYMIRRTRGHIRGALMDLAFYFFWLPLRSVGRLKFAATAVCRQVAQPMYMGPALAFCGTRRGSARRPEVFPK